MRSAIALTGSLALAALVLPACEAGSDARPAEAVHAAHVDGVDMVMYKSPTCGCCDLWVDHIEEHGYSVAAFDIVEYDALVDKKRELGVDMDLGSCHTAVIGGYVVEGHVPADVIRRLLAEQPDIHGIAVPGMPIGSPGMEGPNPMPYQVIAIGRDGSRSIFETVDPRSGTAGSR
jgi:hypothetical protein